MDIQDNNVPQNQDQAPDAASTPQEPVKKPNVTVDFPTETEFPNGLKDAKQDEAMLGLPARSPVDSADILNANQNDAKADSQPARIWIASLGEGFDYVPMGGTYKDLFTRDQSDWKQYLGTERGKVGFAAPSVAEKDGVKLTGKRAVLRVRAMMGLGSIVQVPLWHSGFHITLKTPSDSQLIELRRRFVESKIELGRATHGLVFSNTSSFTTGWILDLVMECVHETSLKNADNIRNMIKAPDLHMLFWGLACCVWPSGFQFTRALMGEDDIKEKKTVSGKINISKLMWVDNNSFTSYQKNHMTQRAAGGLSDEAIKRYQDDFKLVAGRQVDLNHGDNTLKVNLRVPSAHQYVQSGQRWISNMVTMVERTFAGDQEDDQARNRAMIAHANATLMRQYGHWIGSIEIDGHEQEDLETLEEIIDALSEDDDIRAKVMTEVNKFIDDVTVSVIGIPELTGKGTKLERFPNIIPLDPVSVFFTLLMQRTDQVMSR